MIPKIAIIIGAVVIAGAVSASIYDKGRHDMRVAIEAKAAKEAIKRVMELEKNNATFSKLDARGKCLVYMRDSGLPDSGCD